MPTRQKPKTRRKSIRVQRNTKKFKLWFIASFAIAASVVAFSVFASTPPDPATGPPSGVGGTGGTGGSNGTGSVGGSNGTGASSSTSTACAKDDSGNCLPLYCNKVAIAASKPGDACYIPPDPGIGSGCDQNSAQQCLAGGFFGKDLAKIIDFLSALVGIVVVGDIIVGGIQYSMAGGGSDATQKARERMIRGATALGFFLLIFAFLQWIVPGGVFNK